MTQLKQLSQLLQALKNLTMKISINEQAQAVLVSESDEERDYLINVYKKFVHKQQNTITVEGGLLPKRKYKKSGKSRKINYKKTCTVVGCSDRLKGLKGMANHLRMAHGVDKDNRRHETMTHHGRIYKPQYPVYSNDQGLWEIDSSKMVAVN